MSLSIALERIHHAIDSDATELNLSQLQLTAIPKEIQAVKNLQVLDLSDNQISKIENLADLPLQYLNLSSNQISKIENLAGLPLQELVLWSNQISKIENLAGLPLQELYLSNNQISTIENLDNCFFQTLDLQSNKISKIENSIKWITENNLELEFGRFRNRVERVVFISNNPITDCPIEVLEQGHEEIVAYFEAIKK